MFFGNWYTRAVWALTGVDAARYFAFSFTPSDDGVFKFKWTWQARATATSLFAHTVPCTRTHLVPDRKRESIIIGPSKINNGGITFTLFAHTNREYGSTLAQDCGFPLSFL